MKVEAPWSPAIVAALNAYQHRGEVHPYTCGNDSQHHRALRATPEGWVCDDCDYRQAWAHMPRDMGRPS